MTFKRTVTGFLSLAVLSLSLGAAQGATLNEIGDTQPVDSPQQVISAEGLLDSQKQDQETLDPEEHKVVYASFMGTIKGVENFTAIEGAKIVAVENKEGGPANFIIKEDTFLVDNFDLEIGAEIVGFYDANAPMIMIYPPQYNMEVLAEQKENQFVKVDIFNEELVSSDNNLKLNISDQTEVVTRDGKKFKGTLANQKLVIIYDVTTRSIPAQTNPIKVIVLDEKASEDEDKVEIGDLTKMDIVVDEKKLETQKAYQNEDKTIMVPLRDIAEALGYPVSWNQETQSIIIGKGIALKVGDNTYSYYKMAPITLDTAPELKEGTTFVPLEYFTEVMQMSKAEVTNEQIVVVSPEQ